MGSNSHRLSVVQLPSHRGFTLIEVSLSLAIVAVSVLPLIAMLSSGLQTNRQSADRAITAQIVDQVGRDVGQADFAVLPAELPIYYFNDQGVRVEADDLFQVFAARVKIVKTTEFPSDAGLTTSHNLARIQIDVASKSEVVPVSVMFEEDENGVLIAPGTNRFTLFVSR